MRRIVVDTNVLVAFLTDRNEEQQLMAADLFRRASEGELELVLHQLAVVDMVFVLRNLYGLDAGEIAAILEDLLALPGTAPVHEVLWGEVLELWPARIPDFSDAVLAAVALQRSFDSIATFDERFARKLRREKLEPFWKEQGG